ncbi:MAG: DUF4188 domain-containing protein [Blastocatellia bacterium]
MKSKVNRQTVDLTEYPDLVVIYLGMRVNALTGIKTLLGFGPKITKSVEENPDGLLVHENMIYSLFPPHVGMRQYWRDFESLEAWSRSKPHVEWWKQFLHDSGGTAFWHEAYFMRGGMEGFYADLPVQFGFMKFAPVCQARGAMFSARERLHIKGEAVAASPLPEAEYYKDEN